MTSKQFFEMQLACNLTMSELLSIQDALFVAERYYAQHNYKNIANTLDKLYDKLSNVQQHYENLCK